MSDGPRIKLATAQRIASETQSLFAPSCQRIVVAGSVRREKPDVGDIELVIEPRYTAVEQRVNLFDTQTVRQCALEQQVQTLFGMGILQPRFKENGAVISWPKQFTSDSRYLATWYTPNDQERVKLDLFIQRPDRMRVWGWQLLLRTGPGDANTILVTNRNKGGLLPPTFVVKDGTVTTASGLPIPLETEAAVFEAWHMVYVPPQQRSVEAYKQARYEWLKTQAQ